MNKKENNKQEMKYLIMLNSLFIFKKIMDKFYVMNVQVLKEK